MSTVRPSTAAALAAVAMSAALVAGCSGAPQRQVSPTCGVAQRAVDDAQRNSEQAIARISNDASAAAMSLGTVATALSDAEAKVSDAERTKLQGAGTAVASLVQQAQRSAAGQAVDGAAIGNARTALLDAVKSVRADC